MIRKFIHNRHDAASRAALVALESDVQIIDVYGMAAAEQREILDLYEIDQMPYLINREIVMLSNQQQTAGAFTLNFEVRDWQGALVTESVDVFLYVSVGGVQRMESITTDTGAFSLELTCSTAQEIGLKITDYNSDDGIDLFETVIKVVAA